MAGMDDGKTDARGPREPRSSGISGLLEDLVSPDGPPPGDAAAWVPPPSPGTVIGRFEIVRELGRGGFGVVYEALDRDLGRAVAFKLLQASLQPSVREERMLHEAETASRLSHPNIVTLFDMGRCEYGPYLVLELLRGETLAQRLTSGAIPLPEALRIVVEVARALAHAHAKGIVHRDLSTGNVFICEDGHVKVLDLGMAQAFGRRKLEGGTPAFMAPEQRRGAPEDERTDVYALGLMLYRMLTGEAPFPDDDERAASGSRPAPMLHVPESPGVPPVVARMLAKDPVDRYRDAGEVVAALTPLLRGAEGSVGSGNLPAPSRRRSRRGLWVAAAILVALGGLGAAAVLVRHSAEGAIAPPAAGTVPAVAVLPFTDLSPGQDQTHFADGLAEEILNSLVQIEGLRVAGRTSSFSFRGKNAALAEIGRALKVDAVLDGSVRKSGTRLRVTAQLVGVKDGYQLWSQTFDREVADVFAVQDEIARDVAKALQVKLVTERPVASVERRTAVPEAYEQYLLGRQFYHQRGTKEGYGRAVAAFEKSVMADPKYAPAWAGLATSLAGVADLADTAAGVADYKRRAIEAADRAVALGPDIPDGYWARGTVRAAILWDWPGVKADFERSLALNPRHPDTLRRYGIWYLSVIGKDAEALAALKKATEYDPLLSYAWTDLGLLYVKTGQYDLAGAALARALEIAPENVLALRQLSVKYLLEGKAQAALDAAERIPASPWRLMSMALAYHELGRLAESRAALQELEQKEGHGWAFQIAQVHAFAGEADEAFLWLDRALEQRDMGAALEVKGDPLLRRIRGDPRYAALLARMGLPP
jgi:eukaryotic-like serine/threonine-protein kinase